MKLFRERVSARNDKACAQCCSYLIGYYLNRFGVPINSKAPPTLAGLCCLWGRLQRQRFGFGFSRFGFFTDSFFHFFGNTFVFISLIDRLALKWPLAN